MLLFKTKSLVLKIHKINENDFLYTLFSQEYGKILCQKKRNSREKTLDIGYIINCEVETKEGRSIHNIRNIKILHEFSVENKSFGEINSFLESIALLLKNIPEGVPNPQILELYESLYKMNKFNKEKLLLIKLKLLDIFGLLGEEHNDPVTQKILLYISKSPVQDILKLSGISEKNTKDLEQLL